ncbi:MAG: hypothetical protein A2Y94_04435 [Caldithrix sp. RBG_13_44_9]|nr:MAG: hypothetical protein A2Y94_04435 [Caldithrix sp. RBG_13_44_9]
MKVSSKTRYEKVLKLKDSEIDYTDIPETDEKFWKDAEVFYPDQKVQVSIRLDKEIISWFKQFGRGYQTRINSVLRSYITERRREVKKIL